MYEMKDEYKIGIELIDNEHKRLFEIADQLYELLQNDFIADKYDYILAVLNDLKDYTKHHFADEEAYMEQIHYKKIFTQKMQHLAFIEKLDSVTLNDIDDSQKETILDLLNFVNEWLISHILGTDKLITQ